jgi:gliding motility-associated-like protein
MQLLMKTRVLTKLVIALILFWPLAGKATHIVGGEMNYTCLGNDQYEITLTIFRDCYYGNPLAWFDNPASIGIFNADNQLLQQVLVPLMGNDTLNPILTSECLVVPPSVCVHTTTYRTVVTLPPIAGGYQLAYQRCCRNQTIANIIDPLSTGATYGVNISEEALLACNSNPKFQQWPPIYICVNEPIVFDQSAIDQDGDSIVYRLCTPLTGATTFAPMPQPPNNPPYQPVSWVSPPYGVNNMLNGMPGGVPLQIDPHTGLLTGLPNTIGQFVVGICLEEYRDGQLISTTRRDFQYNVGLCGEATAAFAAPQIQCESLTVFFQNNSQGSSSFIWNFNDPGAPTDISTLTNPVHTFSDTGLYTVTLIAGPGSPCEDTAVQQVYLQYNSLFPDFEYTFASCSDSLVIQVTDLTQDTFSVAEAWRWELTPSGQTSDELNPSFVLFSSGDYTLSLTVTAANGCEKTISKPISAILIDDVLSSGTLGVCLGEGAFLNPDFNPGYSYTWAPGPGLSNLNEPNPFVAPLETTVYTVTVTDGSGFCSVEREITVLIPEPVVALAPPDTAVCTQAVLLQGGSNTGVAFAWSAGPDFSQLLSDSASLSIAIMGERRFYLRVEDEFGCTAIDSVTVFGNAVDMLLASQQAVCPGSFGAVTVVNLDANDVLSYQWSPTELIIAGQTSNTAFAWLTEPGAYTFVAEVENQHGCIAIDSTVLVLIDTSTQAAFLADLQCGSYVVNFSSSSVNAPFYQWDFGDPANPNASGQGPAVSYAYPGPGTYQVTVTMSSFIPCSETLTLEVVVEEPQIAAAFSWEIEECSDSLQLQFFDQSTNTQSDILSWHWDFGNGQTSSEQNPQLTLYEPGLLPVRLLILSSDGCRDSVIQQVPINLIQTNLPDSLVVCSGLPFFLNPNPDASLSYLWSPADLLSDPAASNPLVALSAPQAFSVTLTDASGRCQLEREIWVDLAPPLEYSMVRDTHTCGGEFLLFAESPQATAYAWSLSSDFSSLLSQEPEFLVQAGVGELFYLRLTDDFGCSLIDFVEVRDGRILVFVPETRSLCQGDTARLEVVNLTGGALAYTWSPAADILAGQGTGSVLVNPLLDQVFTVQISNEFGCSLTRTTRVVVDDFIPPLEAFADPDTLFSPGEVQLTATFDPNYTYNWQPVAGLSNSFIHNPVARVDSSMTYRVEITDRNGCRNEAIVTILLFLECIEPYIFVPNAFTPNGDGLNDILYVYGNTIDELYFAVYDRWGEKVFDTNRQGVGWDGTFRNQELPPDVYGYYLEARCFNGEVFFKKGNVTLLR